MSVKQGDAEITAWNSIESLWIISLFESRIWEKGCSSGLSVSLCVASTPKCTICFWIESGRTVILSLNKLVVSLSMSRCCLLMLYTALVYCFAATKDFKPMQRTITLKILIFIASSLLPLSPIKFQLHIIGIPTGPLLFFLFFLNKKNNFPIRLHWENSFFCNWAKLISGL